MIRILPSLLAVLFIGLKLTGHITWSWVWVLSPIWLPLFVLGLFAMLCIIVASNSGGTNG